MLESGHKAIHTEFDILTHEARVHTEKADRDNVTYELVFDVDRSVTDDRPDATRSVCGEGMQNRNADLRHG